VIVFDDSFCRIQSVRGRGAWRRIRTLRHPHPKGLHLPMQHACSLLVDDSSIFQPREAVMVKEHA
jgi:hypothetical protein